MIKAPPGLDVGKIRSQSLSRSLSAIAVRSRICVKPGRVPSWSGLQFCAPVGGAVGPQTPYLDLESASLHLSPGLGRDASVCQRAGRGACSSCGGASLNLTPPHVRSAFLKTLMDKRGGKRPCTTPSTTFYRYADNKVQENELSGEKLLAA